MMATPVSEVPLRWRPTAHLHRLATVAAVALIAPFVVGQPLLLVVAAPLLCLLAAGRRGDLPANLSVSVATDSDSCTEGDTVTLTLRTVLERPVEQLVLTLDLAPSVAAVAGPPLLVRDRCEDVTVRWELRPERWGRVRLGRVRVRLQDGARLYAAEAELPLADVRVLPEPTAASAALVPTDLLDRIGLHVGRAAGEGVQFAEIRTFRPGDHARRVNWRVSARRGQLHVTTFAAERAADIVVAVDAFSDVGEGGNSVLDRSLRGATALVQAYLRSADRVGVVVLGGRVRWLGPQGGMRHLFRIAEALLEARVEAPMASPGLQGLPRTALPPGALVVMFSPLLADAAVEAIAGLRRRGHPLVVVNVLAEEPTGDPRDEIDDLTLRLWRLDREALLCRLAATGVPVVSWSGDGPLGPQLAPLAHRPLLGGRT